MAEPSNTNQDGTGANQNGDQNNAGDKGSGTQKTFSQVDLDNVAAKTRAEATAKAEADKQKAIDDAKAEWERQAKLSAEEKVAEENKAQRDDLEKREREVQIAKREIEAHSELSSKNLPTSFVKWVVNVDEAKTKENIALLEKEWSKAIEDGVKAKIEGGTPTDKSNGGKSTKPTAASNGVYRGNGVSAL